MVEIFELHKVVVDAIIDHLNVVHQNADHRLIGAFQHDGRVFEDELDFVGFSNFVFWEFFNHL